MTEPTEEMIEAGYDALMKCKPLQTTDCEKEAVEAIYTAMHEARPTTDVSTDGLDRATRILWGVRDGSIMPERAAELLGLEALQRSNDAKDEALAYAESILTAVSSAGAGEALNRVRKALSHSSEAADEKSV